MVCMHLNQERNPLRPILCWLLTRSCLMTSWEDRLNVTELLEMQDAGRGGESLEWLGSILQNGICILFDSANPRRWCRMSRRYQQSDVDGAHCFFREQLHIWDNEASQQKNVEARGRCEVDKTMWVQSDGIKVTRRVQAGWSRSLEVNKGHCSRTMGAWQALSHLLSWYWFHNVAKELVEPVQHIFWLLEPRG
jgi:hypothetical protein